MISDRVVVYLGTWSTPVVPLSLDLRRRIVESYERGEGSFAKLAARFKVGHCTVERLVKQHRERGHVEPLPHSGGRPSQRLFDREVEALLGYLRERPDLTNPELVEKLVAEFGESVRVDPSQISRVLSREGFTRKKRSSSTPR